MKLKVLALCLALSGCFTPPHDPPPTNPGGGYNAPSPSTRRDDVRVDVPHNRDDRVERSAAAARCAQYGRVEERRSNGEYSCVRPSESTPNSSPDD